MTTWREVVRPTSMDVHCQGGVHVVTWDAGRLLLHHHDLTAEQALIALGGERPACLDILDLWAHLDEDWKVHRGLLVGAPAPPTTLDHVERARQRSERELEQGRRYDRTRSGSAASSHERRVRALADARRALVLHLSAELRLRLALDAVDARSDWEPAGRWPGDDPLDASLLRTLLVPAVQTSSDKAGGKPHHVRVGCRLARRGEPILMTGDWRGGTANVFARLTLRWIPEIWATGMAAVDGWFVANVLERPSPSSARVAAYRWTRDGSGTCRLAMTELTVEATDQGWRATDASRRPESGVRTHQQG